MNGNEPTNLDQSVSEWVESFTEREESIYDFLDEIDRIQLYDAEECRERIRSFAKKSGRNDAFPLILFSLIGQNAFFDDISDVATDDTIQDLRELSQEFSHLEDDFRVVFREEFDGEINPITDNEISTQTPPLPDDPLVTYELFSGSVNAFRTRMRPSDILHLAATAVYSVSAPFVADETDPNLSESELEEVNYEIDHIESHISEVKEWIEDLAHQHDMEISDFDDGFHPNDEDASDSTDNSGDGDG